MNRRGFLGAMLAACAAPAIVRADSLMRIVPVNTGAIYHPDVFNLVMPEVKLFKASETQFIVTRVMGDGDMKVGDTITFANGFFNDVACPVGGYIIAKTAPKRPIGQPLPPYKRNL